MIRTNKKNNFFLAFYAATSGVFIELIGRLMLSEIIALLNLPFINFKKLFKKYEGLRVVLSSLTVFLSALIFSDIINKSAPVDFLRGWSLIIFTMISTVFFVHHLDKNINGVFYYLFVLFIVRMVFGEGNLELTEWEYNTNYFKVRFVGFLNPAIMLMGYYFFSKNKKTLANLLYLSFGLICMAFDARSNGLIFIISSFILYLKSSKLKVTRKRIIRSSIISIIILYIAYVIYVDQVLNNNFGGSNARIQLRMASNPYNPLELIYYGRSELLVLSQAILEKPLWGSGSWAKDQSRIYERIFESFVTSNKNNFPENINPHSIFLGTWFWGGIIGFIATLFMFYKLFKYFYYIYLNKNKYSLLPLIIVLTIDMIWAYFFSPIGSLRTSFPFFASILIVEFERLLQFSKNSEKSKFMKF